ncbi:MAG TPA: phosphoribosylaminoimidazolesuccinocarboxamide synthase [Candidatus Nitrosocosmicus sp.]|nr:phosphoribosylaminoimidazolesuccinocarboxamide synthase [Candidatus Nitrosocosmicus sp.]
MKLIKRGKVKDMYEASDDTIIFSFSNRVSAFDVILKDEIPFKGKVLCDFAVFWFEKLDFNNHFIRRVSPTMIEVKKLQMIPIECVVRSYLYGSLYSRYLKNDLNLDDLNHHFKNKDLQLASKLPQLLFDPTTKSDEHDESITASKILENQMITPNEFNFLKNSSLDLFRKINSIVTNSDFILADIKFEFGKKQSTNKLLLADSIGPDEFRIWNKDDYRPGAVQDSYDKQILRDWLDEIGFKQHVEESRRSKLDPNVPRLPSKLISDISEKYINAYERITGYKFEKSS